MPNLLYTSNMLDIVIYVLFIVLHRMKHWHVLVTFYKNNSIFYFITNALYDKVFIRLDFFLCIQD